jgi:hypothetical protein
MRKARYSTATNTFPKDALPPVDRSRGGFWSISMYDKDYFMLPKSPNGRTNIGTKNLEANELKFAGDGSLTITLSHDEPGDADARANWLPAPEGQFALIVRAYVLTQALFDGSYKLPNVQRQEGATAHWALNRTGCPLLALSGPFILHRQCPLWGKRTLKVS